MSESEFEAALLLRYAFVPLAPVVAICGFVVWKARNGNSLRRWAALVAFVVAVVPFAVSAADWLRASAGLAIEALRYQAYLRHHTRTFARPETIGNVRFPVGTSVVDDGSGILYVTLPGRVTIDGIPTLGRVEVDPKHGLTGTVALTHVATIDGIRCAAADATFVRNTLTRCRLATAALVNGVPCIGDLQREDTFECTLATAYRSHGVVFGAGTDWFVRPGAIVATVGEVPPDFHLNGRTLPKGAIVDLRNGDVDTEFNVRIGDWYGEKAVFDIATGTVTEQDYIGTRHPLPRSTFAFAHVPTLR